jgi:hypothetical protein
MNFVAIAASGRSKKTRKVIEWTRRANAGAMHRDVIQD